MTPQEIAETLRTRAEALGLDAVAVASRSGLSVEDVQHALGAHVQARLRAVVQVADSLGLVTLVVARPFAPAIEGGPAVTEPRVLTRVEKALSQVRSPRTVLFLDLDGTVHAVGDSRIEPDGSMAGELRFRWWPELEAILEQHAAVEVVVHSSWRLFWPTLDSLLPLLPLGLAVRVRDLTDPHIPSRFASIQTYLERHPEVFGYVILDDSRSAFPPRLPQLVLCNPQTGLSDARVRQRLSRALGQAVKQTERQRLRQT